MTHDEIIDEIYQLSSFAVGNGDVCEILARRLRQLAQKIEAEDVEVDRTGNASGEDAEVEK